MINTYIHDDGTKVRYAIFDDGLYLSAVDMDAAGITTDLKDQVYVTTGSTASATTGILLMRKVRGLE
jgi:hypothetical protein